jgi:hypothetical protein
MTVAFQSAFDLGVATLERRPNTHKFNQLRPLSLSLAIA